MSEKIEPALSPAEWARGENYAIRRPVSSTDVHRQLDIVIWGSEPLIALECGDDAISVGGAAALTAIIALTNAALPESDPRKIMRAHVALLRQIAYTEVAEDDGHGSYDSANRPEMDELLALASALEAYLPPESA